MLSKLRIFLLLILAGSLAYTGLQIHDVFLKKRPELVCDEEEVRVSTEVGGMRPLAVKLRNAGNAELRLTEISTSCGCLSPVATELVVPPRTEANIPLTFKDIRGSGIQHYEIAAQTNDPKLPIFMFKVIADMSDVLLFTTSGISSGAAQMRARETFTLRVNPEKKGKIESCSLSSPHDLAGAFFCVKRWHRERRDQHDGADSCGLSRRDAGL